MADWNPWYTTGTVAIANAGTIATGVGTNFHTAGLRAGDMITNAAMTAWAVVTAEPTMPTQLAITAWGGAALPAGSPYRILRISDADRLIGAHADLMAALVPNLTALGALGLAANKGIHATAAGALATHDQTPAARAMLALVGAAGAKIPVVTNTNAAALRDIVGTVSQSGGVPTGAIVERVTNANGTAIKYVGGLMICIRTVTVDMTTTNTQVFDMPVTSVGNGVANGSIVTVNTGVNYSAWGLFTFRSASSVWQLRGPGTGSGTESAILSALGFWHS